MLTVIVPVPKQSLIGLKLLQALRHQLQNSTVPPLAEQLPEQDEYAAQHVYDTFDGLPSVRVPIMYPAKMPKEIQVDAQGKRVEIYEF